MRGYRSRLRRFYEKHKPEDIDKVEETLEKWKEKQLFKKLHEKYVKPKKDAEKKRKEEEKNMTPEERMRRDKERKRAKRREERRAERDIDDEEELKENRKKKTKYFSEDSIADDNIPIFDGLAPVEDWTPKANELKYGVAL